MAHEMYCYSVYDEEIHNYIAVDKPLGEIAEMLDATKSAILTAMKNDFRLKRRYEITRALIEHDKPIPPVQTVKIPPTGANHPSRPQIYPFTSEKQANEFKEAWNATLPIAKKAMKDPEAVRRFLDKQKSDNKQRTVG